MRYRCLCRAPAFLFMRLMRAHFDMMAHAGKMSRADVAIATGGFPLVRQRVARCVPERANLMFSSSAI